MSEQTTSGRFAALKQQMEDNLSKNEEAETFDSTSAETERATVQKRTKLTHPLNDNSKPVTVKTSEKLELILKDTSTPVRNQPQTRKTFSLPMILDLAIKDLKYKRNLDKKMHGATKAKNTEDDIVVEALYLYFSQAGEYKSAFESAQTKFEQLAS